jgi:hypothetical protein
MIPLRISESHFLACIRNTARSMKNDPCLSSCSLNSCLHLPGTCNKSNTTPCLFLSRPRGHTSNTTKSKNVKKQIFKKNVATAMTMVCIDVGCSGTTYSGTLQVFQVFSDLPPFSCVFCVCCVFNMICMMTPSLGSKRCNTICIRIRP